MHPTELHILTTIPTKQLIYLVAVHTAYAILPARYKFNCHCYIFI